MKLILLFKLCVKRIIFIMRMIKKINIVYVSGQPNTNTNTKTNSLRNILRLKLTKWMGDCEKMNGGKCWEAQHYVIKVLRLVTYYPMPNVNCKDAKAFKKYDTFEKASLIYLT